MDPNMMAQLLRERAENMAQQGKAQDQAQIYGSQFQDPQFVVGTPGFSTNIGGHQAQMPGQVQVNYADIIGKGVSNYMQAKGMKESRDLKARGDEIQQMFMQDTLGNDPEAARLYSASKAGIKGADEALIQRISPKKEAMAGLIQGVTSGNLDADMARQLAPKYGIDPEVAAAAADHAKTIADQKAQKALEGKTTLQTLKDEQAMRRTQAQLTSKEGIAAAANLARPARETEASKLAARKNIEYQDAFDNADPAIQKYDDLIKMASEAKWLPLNMGLAPDAVNPKGIMLKQAIPETVLARTGGKLGAGISNADVSFLERATVELAKGNAETAIAMLKSGREHLLKEKEKAAKKLGIPLPGSNANALPKSQYDYTAPKQRENREAVPAFDEMMKEFE